MFNLMHEDLARAHLHERLRQAERQRLVLHAVRRAKVRRAAQQAERAHLRAQQRLQVVTN